MLLKIPLMAMSWKACARAGALLLIGAFLSLFGVFAGLQIAPALGTLLLAPAIGVGLLLDRPLGELAPLPTFAFNSTCWALLLHAASRLLKRARKSS